MESVTAAHAQELAARFLAPENVAVIVVGEARQIRAALEKIGPVTVYDADLKPEAP
jgi:predicted Zn-dependent peptidase